MIHTLSMLSSPRVMPGMEQNKKEHQKRCLLPPWIEHGTLRLRNARSTTELRKLPNHSDRWRISNANNRVDQCCTVRGYIAMHQAALFTSLFLEKAPADMSKRATLPLRLGLC